MASPSPATRRAATRKNASRPRCGRSSIGADARPASAPSRIAADLRDTGDGRRLGLLKLVAGMLGVRLDELVQRETTRRHRRLAILAAGSLGGMVVTSTLAVTAFQSRNEAREQRRQAEGLVGFMLGDLKDKLEPIGRLDALDAVGSRALAYYQAQDKSQLSDEALAQRSRALTLMGEIAQTRGDTRRRAKPLSGGAREHGRSAAPRPGQIRKGCSTMRRTSSRSARSPISGRRRGQAETRLRGI